MLAVITILVSIWFGSRLFIAIDQCFGIIYRLPLRGFIRQNLVALALLMVFVLLIPVLLAVSAAPSFLSTTIMYRVLGNSAGVQLWLSIAGGFAGWIIASLLFLLIYAVLPNRPLRFRDAWRGALIAGALLELYDVAFPFYATHFLKQQLWVNCWLCGAHPHLFLLFWRYPAAG